MFYEILSSIFKDRHVQILCKGDIWKNKHTKILKLTCLASVWFRNTYLKKRRNIQCTNISRQAILNIIMNYVWNTLRTKNNEGVHCLSASIAISIYFLLRRLRGKLCCYCIWFCLMCTVFAHVLNLFFWMIVDKHSFVNICLRKLFQRMNIQEKIKQK